MAASHQRNVDMAARRAAGHSIQMLSSTKSCSPALSSLLPGIQHHPASDGAEHCKDTGSAMVADQVSAASPFLSVVLEDQD